VRSQCAASASTSLPTVGDRLKWLSNCMYGWWLTRGGGDAEGV